MALMLVSCGEDGPPVGNWAIDNGNTLALKNDKTFLMRAGAMVYHGTYSVESPQRKLVLMPEGTPVGIPACYTDDSVDLQDGNKLRIYARQNSDGTLQPITGSTTTSVGGEIVSSKGVCTP
jgi:hypothetical protein